MAKSKRLGDWKQWAKQLKSNIRVLYLACRDPRTPWYAKWFAVCVVAYAFSPIDLIPDFIPVLGYLDDLILVPLGIVLALKMIPGEIITDCRQKVELESDGGRRKNWFMGVLFVLIWIAAAVWISAVAFKM
ncbi:hypothetical protein SD71_07595 [Cohnella kolymensis]|uniref:DUF1232 domain-containing protein n=1 Tax=Cohnella kolymensis TaxID=1590652 RepID=A0ABR5A7T1_9BACL|nr:YkvA family protein [Cohnella kolymensis]KIL36462.1 hypothetical protein SD71_07595 [Cohnella kolymensis]